MSNSYRIISKAGADFGVYQGATAEENNMLTIYTNGNIELDSRRVASVRQTASGTEVFRLTDGSPVPMPSSVYSLAADKPASGIPGRADFERDLRAALA